MIEMMETPTADSADAPRPMFSGVATGYTVLDLFSGIGGILVWAKGPAMFFSYAQVNRLWQTFVKPPAIPLLLPTTFYRADTSYIIRCPKRV